VSRAVGSGRRRLLYFIPTLEGGGAEGQVVQHLQLLSRERFAVELALCHKRGIHVPRVPADVAVHELGGRGSPKAVPRLLRLRRLVATRRIDAVVSHLWYSDLVSLLAGLGARVRVPRVCFVRNDNRRQISDFAHTLRWQDRIGLPLTQRLYRRADRVVFQTRETADHLCRARGIAPAKTAVIPNGVDPARLSERAAHEQPPRWPGPGLRLLAAGRLVPQKGFDLLLDAFARARGQGLVASLLILGEGPERSRLEGIVSRLDLAGAVRLAGFAPNPYPALRHADLLLVPSRWEGLANVLLEALVLETPVLATDCPSGTKRILRGDAGVLVPPDDPAAFAAALLRLAAAPAQRRAVAARGRERARQYAWKRILPPLEELLLSLPRRGEAQVRSREAGHRDHVVGEVEAGTERVEGEHQRGEEQAGA
jgi:glycosyltransferase involved in cell wall biosynthesis